MNAPFSLQDESESLPGPPARARGGTDERRARREGGEGNPSIPEAGPAFKRSCSQGNCCVDCCTQDTGATGYLPVRAAQAHTAAARTRDSGGCDALRFEASVVDS